jgi:hypothetical protein
VSPTGTVVGLSAGPVDISATYNGVVGALSFPIAPCLNVDFNDQVVQLGPVAASSACGFTVRATTSNWVMWTLYGNPAPSIVFMSPRGTTIVGEVAVTAGGTPFKFVSVDVYSSTTAIPYVVTGIRNGATVYRIQQTQGQNFGAFATQSSGAQSTVYVDSLVIQLTNTSAPCCDNPMGIDNIRLSF